MTRDDLDMINLTSFLPGDAQDSIFNRENGYLQQIPHSTLCAAIK